MNDRPKPGDYQIGSPESRAAARMFAANRQDMRTRIEYVSHIPRPWHGEKPEPKDWNKKPCVGPWQGCGDTLMRVLFVPDGMGAAEARRIVEMDVSVSS